MIDPGRGIGHKLPLTPTTRSWLPPSLLQGMNRINVDAPVFLFTAAVRPATHQPGDFPTSRRTST